MLNPNNTEMDWKITDPDCNQMGRKLANGVYEFKEERVNPETGKKEVHQATIDFSEYPNVVKGYYDNFIWNCVSTYGYQYDGNLMIEGMTAEESAWIIAEILFELS